MLAEGRKTAPFLVVMSHKVSDNMMDWFWKMVHDECGILKTDVRVIYLLNEAPKGQGGRPTKDQLRESWKRFSTEIKNSTPRVVMPMGSVPLYYLTGIKESIFESRGYIINRDFFRTVEWETYDQIGEYKTNNKTRQIKKGDPRYGWVTHGIAGLLGPDFDGLVIPTYQLDHIRLSGFSLKPAFKIDLLKVKRILSDRLQMVDLNFKFYTDFNTLAVPSGGGMVEITAPNLGSTKWDDDVVAIDIETHGVDNEVIDRVSISDGHTSASLEWNLEAVNLLNSLLRSHSNRLFAFHNSPFDVPRLKANGVEITEEILRERIFDTMFGSVTLQPDLPKGLGSCVTLYLDAFPWKWRELSEADPVFYSAKDAFMTAWLARAEIQTMKRHGLWNLFTGNNNFPGPGIMATIPELTDMHRRGIKTNREYAEWWMPKLERHEFRLEKLWARNFPTINPHSPAQLQSLLYQQWELPVQKNREGGISVDELSLIRLKTYITIAPPDDQGAWRKDPRCNERVFDLILKLRDVSKTLSTYVQPVAINESTWVHPSYMPISKDDETGKNKALGNHPRGMTSKGNTSTGRLATFKPNIGNQPKKVRKLYVPDTPNMCFIQGDGKMAELFAMAFASGDKQLMDDLKYDLHTRNAERFGIRRDVAKNVMYASQYLAGPAKVSEMILAQEHVYIPVEECRRIMKGLESVYHVTTAYKRHLVTLCETEHYIRNPFGRVRYFHDSNGPSAVDFIPQSIVADWLWCLLKEIADMARFYGGRLTTTVYDSVLIQVPSHNVMRAAKELKEIMEKPFPIVAEGFFIPCELEIGEPGASWGNLKKGVMLA